MKIVRFKTVLTSFLSIALVATLTLFIAGCDNEDDPSPLNLTSLAAGAVDLNAATSATGVPVDSDIVAEFSTNVDESSVSAITITRDVDDANVPFTASVDGSTVTINPDETLGTGTLYIINFGAGLKSTQGQMLTEAIERNFTTEGTFAAPGAVAQWTFEDNADDVVGSFDPAANQIVEITYGPSHNSAAGKAAVFNGTTSIIEISNGDQLMETNDFSLSFWMKPEEHTDNPDKGHFVMGLGAFYGFQFEIYGGYGGWKMPVSYEYDMDGTIGQASEDNGFNGDGKNKDNGGWKGFIFTKDLSASGGVAEMIKNKWTHIVFVYDSETKHGYYYANGELMREFDFNLWGETDIKAHVTGVTYRGTAPDVLNELAFGFVHSRGGTMWDAEPWGGYDLASANHFKGSLDDVIIYHRPLTAAEIGLMYNSGKP